MTAANGVLRFPWNGTPPPSSVSQALYGVSEVRFSLYVVLCRRSHAMASVDALSVRTVLGERLAAAESYQDVALAVLGQYDGTTRHTISDRT